MATLTTVAHGELLIEEGFGYGQTSWVWDGDYAGPVTDTGLNGGTGFASGSQWGIVLQSGTTGTVSIADGITFSTLETSGNALFTQNLSNSALASRAIGVDVPTGTTLWTSYLWSQTNAPVSSTSTAYSQLTSSQFGTTNRRLRILPNQYHSSTISSISDGSARYDLTIPTLQDGDTYLMIAKNSNIGQSGTGTLWAIAESGFDICAADGSVSEQELNDNCVGTVSGAFGSNTMPSGEFLQIANVWGAGTFDELRMGTALADVTPIIHDMLPGDANDDGTVDDSDATILAGNWQLGVDGTVYAIWGQGDFNDDGKVDEFDATILAANWQTAASASASVPEPSTLLLIISALAGLFAVRIKKR